MSASLKKVTTLFAFVLIASTCFSQVYLKSRAKEYLNKTASIIKATHGELPKVDDKDKRGFFAKSVKHQRFARVQFQVQDYKHAIYHSHLAREMAFKVYMHDNDKFPKSWEYSNDEKGLLKGRPTDTQLDERLIKENPQITFEDDPYITIEELEDLNIR